MNKENVPKRVRFTSDDDLALLREVVNVNPLKDVEKWKDIQDAVQVLTGKLFTVRSLKDHLHLMLEVWRKKDAADVGKSGIEEIYSEKDSLLQEITDICRELNTPIKGKKTKVVSRNNRIIILGKEHRASTSAAFYQEKVSDDTVVIEENETSIGEVNMHDYCISQIENEEISSVPEIVIQQESAAAITNENPPPTSDTAKPNKLKMPKLRAVRKSALNFVEERNATERDFKKRQLDLEERRMQLDEERFQLEKEERKFKMKLEEEKFFLEKTNNNNQQMLIEQQKKMIDLLIKKLDS